MLLSLYLPECLLAGFTYGLGLLMKSWYFAPRSHVRRTARNFCRLTERADPRKLYFQLIDNVVRSCRLFGQLMRHGPDAVADQTDFAETSLAICHEAFEKAGTAIFVVPHCAGSVLSAARLGKEFPTVILARESKSPRRSRIMLKYLEKLGPELLQVRRSDPTSIARGILRAFRSGQFVVGTTDLARRKADTLEVEMFGKSVWVPDWPARFSARRGVPIIPGYVHMENGRIRMIAGEPFVEKDVSVATQRWASFFEENIRRYPEDWLFMFDKRWARVLAEAAADGAD